MRTKPTLIQIRVNLPKRYSGLADCQFYGWIVIYPLEPHVSGWKPNLHYSKSKGLSNLLEFTLQRVSDPQSTLKRELQRRRPLFQPTLLDLVLSLNF